MKRTSALLALTFGVSGYLPAQASGPVPPDFREFGFVLAVHVRGMELPSGQMWYEIDPGPIATHAVRMYSEPSHTRVAMVVDPEYRSSPAGKAWMKSVPDFRSSFIR